MLSEVTNDDWMDFWEGPTPEDLPTIRKPQMIEVEQEYIDGMIKRLEDAIDVCYNAPDNPKEQGYPYATGYSRSCMIAIMEMLQDLKNDD